METSRLRMDGSIPIGRADRSSGSEESERSYTSTAGV